MARTAAASGSPADAGEGGRREQIIGVATTLFRRNGYHATSLDDVAETIGFTKPAIYYYFDSKEDILFQIVDQIVDAALARMQGIADSGGTPTERLRAMLVENTRIILENIDANTVFYNERGLLSPHREAAIRDREREYTALLHDLYDEGVAAGEFVDVDAGVATSTLFGASIWSHRWFVPTGRMPAEEVAETIADLLVGGVLRHD